MLDSANNLDTNDKMSAYSVAHHVSGKCPPATGWSGGFSLYCGNYGTVVPANSISSSYVLPDDVMSHAESSRAACCDVFSMTASGYKVTCSVATEFSDSFRPSNGEYHPSLGYDCTGYRLSDDSPAPASSIGFSGSWWHFSGTLAEHEELIRLELGYGDTWTELQNSAHRYQDDNGKACPELKNTKWSPKVNDIKCVTFNAATTTLPTTTWDTSGSTSNSAGATSNPDSASNPSSIFDMLTTGSADSHCNLKHSIVLAIIFGQYLLR